MATTARKTDSRGPAVEVYMLGTLDFDVALALQQRLVYELSGRNDGQIALLICEHPNLITIGRQGSRDHIRLSDRGLARRQVALRWVNRGGGCLLHTPGQLALYPIVPLAWYGLSVGEYLQRLQSGMLQALAELRVTSHTRPGRHGIWGRGGQLAVFGAAVKHWTTYYGAYLNVRPATGIFPYVDSDPVDHTPMSSLSAQRQRPLSISAVRSALVPHLSAAFGCQRYHLYSGHPLLTWARGACRGRDAVARDRQTASRRAG